MIKHDSPLGITVLTSDTGHAPHEAVVAFCAATALPVALGRALQRENAVLVLSVLEEDVAQLFQTVHAEGRDERAGPGFLLTVFDN